MFEKLLIARRGEVVARVAKTCKRLGLHVVALHSQPGESVHVEACDEALEVDDVDGRLVVDEIVEKAKSSGVDAVYPGFSSQTQHAELARALEAEGIPCVGADPDVLDLVADRPALRAIAQQEVRCVPCAPVADLDGALQAAREIRYPVALRDTRTDGRRPVLLDDEDALHAAWPAFAREGQMHLIEARFPRARRIDILLAADGEGEVAALGEMERSILGSDGRSVLVECPSPELIIRVDGESLRDMLYDASIRVARHLSIAGLLRVTTWVDPDGRIWLDGVTVGLPSMHASLEQVLGLDLVALQLKIASGEPLGDEALYVQAKGHGVAASLLATDAEARHTVLEDVRYPSVPTRMVRLESSVRDGVATPPDDWPRLAKLSAFAPVRRQAVQALDRMIAATVVTPVATNAAELRATLTHELFRAGQYDISFRPTPIPRSA